MITFTYEDILARLQASLKEKLGNSDMLFFSTNQRILEAIAEELSEQMRYDEYLMREAKWSTSQNLSSILNQIDFFNYIPHRKIGCTGNLKVSASPTFDTTYPTRIIIPKFSQFASDNLTFVSTEEVELLNNTTSVQVPIKQGEYRESVFDITYAYTDQELISFSIDIDNPNVDNSTFEVYVEGQLWRYVEHLGYSTGAVDTVYEIRNFNDFSGITIHFGDGITSKKISHGDTIVVKWVETLGLEGELLQTNAITKVLSTFTSNNKTVKLYCKNEEIISGGDDYESIQSIKYNAPRALRLSSRLISKADYQNFILGNAFADKVTVWGETETNIDNGDDMGNYVDDQHNLVFVSGLNFASDNVGLPLNEVQQRAIRDAMAPIKSLTDIVQFVDPQVTYLDFTIRGGYRSDKYIADQVRSAVTQALLDTYALNHADRRFKETLYFSQYYELINSLPEIEWHETTLLMVQYPSWIPDTSEPFAPTYKFKIELNHSYIFCDADTGFGEVELFIRNINADLPELHPYKNWYRIARMSCVEIPVDGRVGYLIPDVVPVWSEGDNFSLPDAGLAYDITSTNLDDRFNYTRGAYVNNALDNVSAVELQLNNGMCEDLESGVSKASDYQLRIEFNGGTNIDIDTVLRTNVIPSRRNQLFACESVAFETLTPISAESNMGY